MRIPKTVVTDARNTLLMFGATYAVQISLLGTANLSKHLIVAAAVAAGQKVLTAEAPVILAQVGPDVEKRLAAVEGAVHTVLVPALTKADPVAGAAVRRVEGQLAELAAVTAPVEAQPAPAQAAADHLIATEMVPAPAPAAADFNNPPVVAEAQPA